MKYFFLIYPLLYATILSIGIFKFSKIRNNFYLKLFLIFIGYSLLTEILGYVVGVILGMNTFHIYNTWNLVNGFFYFFFFLNLLKDSFKRNLLKFIIVAYLIFTIVDIIFISNFMYKLMGLNIIVGAILIVISVLLYFSELLQSDLILNVKDSIFFYISLGVFLFNIGFIPVYVIAEYISYSGIFRVITLILNVLMAGCFITGFIVSKKEYNN